MRLLHCFWNNFRQISSINGYSNVINGNENFKSCEFCLKILHRECREVAKKLWFWWNIVDHLYETNTFYSKILILQNNFKLDKSYDFPKAILHQCQRSCEFVYLYSSFVLKVQCFYFRRSKGPLVLLSTRDKRVAITFPKNQRLNTGNQ